MPKSFVAGTLPLIRCLNSQHLEHPPATLQHLILMPCRWLPCTATLTTECYVTEMYFVYSLLYVVVTDNILLRQLWLSPHLAHSGFKTTFSGSWLNQFVRHYCKWLVTLPPVCTGSGVLFSLDFFLCLFLSFFVCFFVSKVTRKRLDRFA